MVYLRTSEEGERMEKGFGVVGVGMIAATHAKALGEAAGARLVACTDLNQERCDAFAKEHNCKGYAAMDDFLADPDLEVVAICTPSGAHMEPAVAAAEAGKHVLIEKPLEITLDRCDRIIEACESAGVVCAGVFPSRTWDTSRLVKEAIDAGRFGRITLAAAQNKFFRTQEYYDTGGWHGTWRLDGGGALMNQGIHAVDLLLWLMGPVASVEALTDTLGHENIEVEDTAVAVVRFVSGAFGTIAATTTAYPGFVRRMEVSGTKGSVCLVQNSLDYWGFSEETADDEEIRKKFSETVLTGGGASDPSNTNHVGHQVQIEDMVRAIDSGLSPMVDGPEARRAVELIVAIYESAKTGKAISLV